MGRKSWDWTHTHTHTRPPTHDHHSDQRDGAQELGLDVDFGVVLAAVE